jgi:FkbH-like protein
LPEVYVPEWPEDKTLFASRLLELDCFDSAHITPEDALRNQAYASEKQRAFSRKTVSSAEEWLLSLDTEVTVEEFGEGNRVRVVQLLNKTNQMNLTTRRVSEQELQAWLKQGDRKLWAFRVKDKFGDSGLTGVLSLEVDADRGLITDFVLSCRVMGRHVENAMVAFAAKYCVGRGTRELRANYLPTPKNKPCLKFWSSSGFLFEPAENRFTWRLTEPYAFPEGIKIHPPRAGSDPLRSQGETVRDAEDAPLPAFTD